MGEVTHDLNDIFHSLSEHWLWFIALLVQHLHPVIQVAPVLIYATAILLPGLGANWRG